MNKHGDSINKFVGNPAIDFILVRKNKQDVMVINQEGTATVTISGDKMGYKSITANPLGIDDIETSLSEKDAFDYCYDSDYPDSLYQIKQLFSSQRAGDVVVSANVGYDLRDFWEIPEHLGSHGSLHKDHLYIPLLLNKPNMLPHPVRSSHIHGVIKEYLSQ